MLIFLLYSKIVVDKLSDRILAQFIIVALIAASTRCNHFDENLLLFGLPNNLNNIATMKQKGEQRKPVAYIPFNLSLVFPHY